MKKLLIIAIFALFATACNHVADYSPREVNYERDICVQCLMGIADQPWAVQAINSHSEVVWFDDIGCLHEYMTGKPWKDFIGTEKIQIWIGDADHKGKWLDATKAYYRYGDHTPMGYGYSAIENPNDSTFTYEETLKRIGEGKTMREEFLRKHKMMGKGKMNH